MGLDLQYCNEVFVVRASIRYWDRFQNNKIWFSNSNFGFTWRFCQLDQCIPTQFTTGDSNLMQIPSRTSSDTDSYFACYGLYWVLIVYLGSNCEFESMVPIW